MFDGNEYFAQENETVDRDYPGMCVSLAEARNATEGDSRPWSDFVHRSAILLIRLADLEAGQNERTATLPELAAENDAIFETFSPEHYAHSFADPTYAVECLGHGTGSLASLITARWRSLPQAAFLHQRFLLANSFRRFLEIIAIGEDAEVTEDKLRQILKRHAQEERRLEIDVDLRMQWDPAFRFARDIAESTEPGDLRALYSYGSRVTDHDIRTARFMSELPQEKIDRIADVLLAGYLRGFEIGGKDITLKSTAIVVGRIGFERVFKRLFAGLEREGLAPCYVARPSTKLNQQFDYDHRFDYAVTFDRALLESRLEEAQTALQARSDLLKQASGFIGLEVFGAKPFTPKLKEACLATDEDTARLHMEYSSRYGQMVNAVTPRQEQSFSVIAFPSPEIRGDFEAIFADTLELNILENEHYEHIQHDIIAALDQARSVRVLGRGTNRTDLNVMLPPLTDPDTQTNFVNCVADVNIPLGEVFTSPQLTGTHGVLHVEDVFLKGLQFRDLELTFQDGCITDYRCSNFEVDETNRKYVHENLIYPHESLPIGEFAIGTNTLAYAMAKRHGIMDVLPVLIIEKMGPHLAVGDTCFAWQEDHALRNPLDGKEVVARENERSCQRKEDPSKAYTNTHIDITLPYSSLDTIAAVLPSGDEIVIIRGGRFVLPGTEGLNAAIEEVDG